MLIAMRADAVEPTTVRLMLENDVVAALFGFGVAAIEASEPKSSL